MKFEINKELVLSTAHVKETTLHGCFKYDYLDDNNYSKDPDSLRFHVETCLEDSDDIVYIFPDEFLELLNIARKHDCKWLVLDGDVEISEGVPVYPW